MTVKTVSLLRLPLILGAIAALLAVLAGAFGAHGLRGIVDSDGLAVYQTAVTYQMYHGLALVLVAVLAGLGCSRRLLSIAAGFFTVGILFFSGSLYLMVLAKFYAIGPVTPLGGLCFMVGWALVVAAGLKKTS